MLTVEKKNFIVPICQLEILCVQCAYLGWKPQINYIRQRLGKNAEKRQILNVVFLLFVFCIFNF